MSDFSVLLDALDWHLNDQEDAITRAYARDIIKWAAELMDKKFDLPYERLPQ